MTTRNDGYQAIQTKYHGPTNTRGSRISAKCSAGKISIPYPYDLSGTECHRKAAIALCEKLKWNPEAMVAGGLPDNTCVFVFTDCPAKS